MTQTCTASVQTPAMAAHCTQWKVSGRQSILITMNGYECPFWLQLSSNHTAPLSIPLTNELSWRSFAFFLQQPPLCSDLINSFTSPKSLLQILLIWILSQSPRSWNLQPPNQALSSNLTLILLSFCPMYYCLLNPYIIYWACYINM